MLGSATAQVPLGTNREGYRAPLVLSGGGGPVWRWRPRVQLLAGAEWVYESPERWHTEPHGGRHAALVTGGTQLALRPGLSLLAELRAPVWQKLHVSAHEEDEDGQLRQLPLGRLALSWTP